MINLYLLRRSIRFFYQRLTRGWDDSDTWSLDVTIAKFVLPRLKRFKELNNGFPYEETQESWNEKLDDMIYAMEFELKQFDTNDYDMNRVNRGFELFGKHFHYLWW